MQTGGGYGALTKIYGYPSLVSAVSKLPLYFFARGRKNRGDTTPIELFIAGVLWEFSVLCGIGNRLFEPA